MRTLVFVLAALLPAGGCGSSPGTPDHDTGRSSSLLESLLDSVKAAGIERTPFCEELDADTIGTAFGQAEGSTVLRSVQTPGVPYQVSIDPQRHIGTSWACTFTASAPEHVAIEGFSFSALIQGKELTRAEYDAHAADLSPASSLCTRTRTDSFGPRAIATSCSDGPNHLRVDYLNRVGSSVVECRAESGGFVPLETLQHGMDRVCPRVLAAMSD